MAASAPEAAAGAGEAPAELAPRFAALGLSSAALADFAAWRAMLAGWSARMNLIGPKELDRFWDRHALDSAQLLPLAPLDARWIDLGAGAGFPGLAVAIAQKHAARHAAHNAAQHEGHDAGGGATVLVESVGKKAGFLSAVAEALDLPARVMPLRWQALDREPFGVVTARAFAPLPRLFEAARHFWGKDTIGIFPKGKGLDDEIAAARADWRFEAERVRSITGDGAILRVTDLKPR